MGKIKETVTPEDMKKIQDYLRNLKNIEESPEYEQAKKHADMLRTVFAEAKQFPPNFWDTIYRQPLL